MLCSLFQLFPETAALVNPFIFFLLKVARIGCWLSVYSKTADLLPIFVFSLKIEVSKVWLTVPIARGYMNYWLFLLILMLYIHKAAVLKVDSFKTNRNRLAVTAPSMQQLIHPKIWLLVPLRVHPLIFILWNSDRSLHIPSRCCWRCFKDPIKFDREGSLYSIEIVEWSLKIIRWFPSCFGWDPPTSLKK